MLGRARVQFTWTEPPSAEDIRKLDQDRLLQNPILTEPSTDDELSMANSLLAAHNPQNIAAAFVKMYRATLPAPEDIAEVFEPRSEQRGTRETQAPREPRNRAERREQKFGQEKNGPDKHAPRERSEVARPTPRPGDMENGVWFKITVGRERNADAKWLLPEICRQGEITKKDIGAIRVYERETRFEVSSDAAEAFAAHVAARKKGGVRIFAAPDGPGIDTAPDGLDSAPPRSHASKLPFIKAKKFVGKRKHAKSK
jgi:ATP-dependent RNA helicase DeaD